MVKKLKDKELSALVDRRCREVERDRVAGITGDNGRKPLEIRDTEENGLTFRLQPSGVATFYFQFRDKVTGKQGRVKLGRYREEIGLPRARELTILARAEVTDKKNPADERREARKAQQAPDALTLRQFIDGDYRSWAESNLKSHKETLSRLRYGFESLLDRPLSDLSLYDFEQNRKTRLAGKPKSKGNHGPRSVATVNRDQAHMRAALSRAVAWGKLDKNPIAGVTRAKEDKNKTIRPLDKSEEGRMLEVFKSRRQAMIAERQELIRKGEPAGPIPPRFATFLEPLVILSVDTGLRRGEALQLTWSDLDLEGRKVTVQGSGAKSSQTRVVDLSTRATTTLKAWRRQSRGQGRVFPKATVNALKGQYSRLLRDAKIVGLRWHDLRHTFGTRAAAAGVPIMTIKKLMGHSSITTTERYLHATAEDTRKAIEQIEKAHKGQEEDSQQ